MQTVEETIDVAVPVRTAYDQWTQFESFPNFMSGVESVTQLTDTTNHWKTKIGGVEREFDTEIVGIVSNFDFLKCFAFNPGRMVPAYDDLLSRIGRGCHDAGIHLCRSGDEADAGIAVDGGPPDEERPRAGCRTAAGRDHRARRYHARADREHARVSCAPDRPACA